MPLAPLFNGVGWILYVSYCSYMLLPMFSRFSSSFGSPCKRWRGLGYIIACGCSSSRKQGLHFVLYSELRLVSRR
jgi:hypothetical protein